ncbi:glycosyltransferase family 2 protein [Candidatus Falkowbacteria bacterium]|jgi:GT2 family glycosyltransferase|nr:glycosyltransferase family 2 protein [Candidatus Falkowbacteria bacterium]
MNKKVGIVLINFQNYAERFLLPCRDSLRCQDYPADLINVYIIDNASTAGTLEYLRVNYPEAKILPRLDGNYAAANNLGFAEAKADGCDYLLTVNMDTRMEPTWLRELVAALENNPEAGIAQSKILLLPRTAEEKESPKINSLGNRIHFLGFGFTSAYGEADREISGYPEITGYASGCSFIIRPEVFTKIGGYNEEYYMYHDDLEISLKVKLAGYKIILAPRSVIYHQYEFSRSTKMIYYMERNRYLTIMTFYPAYLVFLIILPCIIMDLGMFFYSMIRGWFKEEMKVYRYFLRFKNYSLVEKEKAKIEAFKTVPFSKIAKNFVGKIEFIEIANPILKYIVNPVFNLYWRLIRKIV